MDDNLKSRFDSLTNKMKLSANINTEFMNKFKIKVNTIYELIIRVNAFIKKLTSDKLKLTDEIQNLNTYIDNNKDKDKDKLDDAQQNIIKLTDKLKLVDSYLKNIEASYDKLQSTTNTNISESEKDVDKIITELTAIISPPLNPSATVFTPSTNGKGGRKTRKRKAIKTRRQKGGFYASFGKKNKRSSKRRSRSSSKSK